MDQKRERLRSPTRKTIDSAYQALSGQNYTEKEKWLIARHAGLAEDKEKEQIEEDLRLLHEKDLKVKEQKDKIKALEEENEKLKQKKDCDTKYFAIGPQDEKKNFKDYMDEYEKTQEYKNMCERDKRFNDMLLNYDDEM